MREIGAAVLKEALTASIWAASASALRTARRPVWSHFLFTETVSLPTDLPFAVSGLRQ